MENKEMETQVPKKENAWEIKDRTYFLKGDATPVSRMIKATNIYYFDPQS